MARRTPTSNGVRENGDGPPPSTLAAQIVQNRIGNEATPKNGDAPTFSQLLHEILNNQAATIETDVATNVKLINVVAEAGLAPLADFDPFAQWDVLIPQASKSLAVIEATIKRQPEVLLTSITQDGQQPLLPLLARLFAVGGKQKCEALHINKLLDSMLLSLDSSLHLWKHAQSVRQILQECMSEIVAFLESSATTTMNLSVKLPPARSIAKLWPSAETAITVPYGFQTTITDPTQALMLGLCLVKVQRQSQSWRMETSNTLQQLAIIHASRLENSKQWELACLGLLTTPNNLPYLVYVFARLAVGTVSVDVQRSLARALIRMLRQDGSAVRDQLLSTLVSISSQDPFDKLHEDLTIAIATTICRVCPYDGWPDRVEAMHEAVRQDNVMTDSDLQAAFKELTVQGAVPHTRRKKRKIAQDQTSDKRTTMFRTVTKLLTGIESQDLSALPEVAPSVYRSLSHEDQCAAWQALNDLANTEPQKSIEIVSRLLDDGQYRDNKIRVLSILAIHTCLRSSQDVTYLDVGRSSLGQLCLRSLTSSLREVRMAAARSLECFIRGDLQPELMERNRKAILGHLRSLSDRGIASEQETLVSAWCQVAIICEDAELNLALLQLVNYLGHANPFIHGLASNELERLADAKSSSMEELFRPFWQSVAFSVVRDLQSRPQKARQLCDLLNIEIDQFLVQTQLETIPSLVLTKNKEVLERVATACGHNGSVPELLFQPRTNLMATLALLLSQAFPDADRRAIDCLVYVAPGLSDTDIHALVKVDAVLLACDMLKSIGDQDPSRKSRAYQAFYTFAAIAENRPVQSKSKSTRAVSDFFDIHVLGIMAHFSEILASTLTFYSTKEKLRCVKGIAEMIVLAKSQVSVALPQIRAALQSAMNDQELCEAAFFAWLKLPDALEVEDIARIMDQTFALIIRHWSLLSSELRQNIHAAVIALIQSHNQVLRDNIMTLPSLEGIPLLSKVAGEIDRLKGSESPDALFRAFAMRLRDESTVVVRQALQELPAFLKHHLDFIHESATSEQPNVALPVLLRALLDATTEYAAGDDDTAELCGQSLGVIGCLDPNRVEATRVKRRTVVLYNFDRAEEVIDWAIVFLEDVLVKAFKSISNARSQGFLAYVLQELLAFCGFNDGTVLRPRTSQAPSVHQKWINMPEHVRITLTPFVTSKYVITSAATHKPPVRVYPSFTLDSSHSSWIRSLVYDLMLKAKGENAQMVFPLLARTIRGHDLACASFMFPYAALNVVLGGTVAETQDISKEFMAVLDCNPTDKVKENNAKLCSESVFNALDYMSTWLQEKRRVLGETRATAYRTGLSPSDFDEARDTAQIETVERFMASIPADIIATRAVLCGSYARALCNWEQHIRKKRPLVPSAQPPEQDSTDAALYDKLQEIYAQIDEPDGLEGISAHLRFLTEEQQAMQHVKAGRWSAAQAWYELQLAHKLEDEETERLLLDCFRETGRYEPLLRYADNFIAERDQVSEAEALTKTLLPIILEARWMIADSAGLRRCLIRDNPQPPDDFNVGVAYSLVAAMEHADDEIAEGTKTLRRLVTQSMTVARTGSVQAVHEDLKKLHMLHEIDVLNACSGVLSHQVNADFERRLAVTGSSAADKQYILGARRAFMEAKGNFNKLEVGSSWLTTAKLARQSGNTDHAYNAVLKAFQCGDKRAKIEEARLLWRDGHQRHAIHALESAIASGMFKIPEDANIRPNESNVTTRSTSTTQQTEQQNVVSAKVHLLLAKWLDASGQTQVRDLTEKFQYAAKEFSRWEKGHYYLGRHYQKIFDTESALPKEKQSQQHLSGEQAKLVVENLIRSVPFGNKYWHQTIPKILTLWLDLGLSAVKKAPGEDAAVFDRRVKALQGCTRQLQKYFDRVPAFVFYSALPQMISRITHPNPEVWKVLSNTIHRIVAAHPNQALWSLLAVVKATDRTRAERGTEILNRLKDPKAKPKAEASNVDLRDLIARGQRLCDALLRVCEVPLEKQGSEVRLSDDLGFNHKLAPSQLVVPVEKTLSVNLPLGASQDMIKRHKAFVQDKVTIQAFAEDVLVLNSLQRPRKLTVRGSDGKQYGLLCKPKDDLRKDRRLMEFNGIINRVLKRDAESSKRRLYVKTYAVTPLSEDSGIIEWVEGIKPMRDILLGLYFRRGIRPNYTEIKTLLDQACTSPEHAYIFVNNVLNRYPPVLHEWFAEVYPESEAWFAARLRYARSAAVMSIAGHVLGLGDRHGENILLEEGTGGVFHVDFNCLFDKGLTFDKPELVPFRLTHNMVDAMGPYGYEGPFRKSSELTYKLLRQNKDTLMTVLETFLYDPTTDFVGHKKKRSNTNAPETPQEILDGVEGKLKGLLRGEKVPLGVEGYVDALIREATSPFCLASMYIGWCAFL